MSMYQGVTPELLRRFLGRLGGTYRGTGALYLVGGTGLLFQGLKAYTKDIDISTELPAVSRDRFGETVRHLARELNIAVEEVSPADFIPLPSGAGGRHIHLGREGSLDIYAFDPLSTALAKIARGRAGDYADIGALVRAGQIDGLQLEQGLQEILPRVAAGEALRIDPATFRAHLDDFLATLGQAATPFRASEVQSVEARGDALAAAFRLLVDKLQATRMALTSERIDDAALRELALARPGATQQALREALLAGSTAIEALAAADAARYADAAVARALADPAVLRARAASPNDADDPHVC